jgi:hypothetical protein
MMKKLQYLTKLHCVILFYNIWNTGGPRSFYLRICLFVIENLLFIEPIMYFKVIFSFLYANSLYVSHIFRSLSLAYNEVRLSIRVFLLLPEEKARKGPIGNMP